MATVFEKFYNPDKYTQNRERMFAEEIADAIYCICNAIEDGVFYQAGPENLEIKEDGTVIYLSEDFENLYYTAPEMLMNYGKADKEAGWFTLGLLMYFIIYGRSFYEDNKIQLVQIPDIQKECAYLIKQTDRNRDEEYGVRASTGMTEADAVVELLKESMKKLTLWERGKRSEGVGLLLKAIKEYISVAELIYICDNQEVKREKKEITAGNTISICVGDSLMGTDGTSYTINQAISIPYRPGMHTYKIFVTCCDTQEDVEGQPLRKDLFMKEKGHRGVPLMKLEERERTVKVEVERSSKKSFVFSIVESNPVQKRVIEVKDVYYLDVPAGMDGEKSLLQITYKQDFSQTTTTRYLCEMALYNREGTKQISDNTMRFFV